MEVARAERRWPLGVAREERRLGLAQEGRRQQRLVGAAQEEADIGMEARAKGKGVDEMEALGGLGERGRNPRRLRRSTRGGGLILTHEGGAFTSAAPLTIGELAPQL